MCFCQSVTYHSTWVRGPHRSPLDWAGKYVCAMSVACLSVISKKKKIDGLVVQLNEDTVQAKSSMLVVRSVIGYIVSYGIEVSNGNSNTQSTILKNWVRGRFLKFSCYYLNSFSTVSEIISQKVFACLSRQYSLLLNAKAPKTCMASLYPHSVSRHFRRHFLNQGSNIEDCFG